MDNFWERYENFVLESEELLSMHNYLRNIDVFFGTLIEFEKKHGAKFRVLQSPPDAIISNRVSLLERNEKIFDLNLAGCEKDPGFEPYSIEKIIVMPYATLSWMKEKRLAGIIESEFLSKSKGFKFLEGNLTGIPVGRIN